MKQGEGGTPNINMNNLNQMTNLAVGGGVQVPGGMPNMAQAQQNPDMSNGPGSKALERSLLNTYIYDYFIRHNMYDSARAILQEAEVSTQPGTSVRRGSPSRRSQKHDPDGNLINGIDDPMDSDRKDDEGSERGADLPLPKVPQDSSGGSFLYDWWSLFWDIFGARTGKAVSVPAMTYVNQVQVQAKSREQQQRLLQITQAGGLMAGQLPQQFIAGYPGNQMLRVPNGVIHADDVLQKNNLARQAMANNVSQRNKPQFTPNPNQQQLQQQLKTQQQQQAMIQQQQMQRDQSVDGERPQSPAPGQNGSSPSKRARLEGDFQSGVGRGQLQNMPAGQANAQAMLMHHGINQLTPGQFAQFNNANPAVQAKLTAAYAQNLRMAQAQQQNAAVNAVMGNPALAKGVMPNGQMAGVSAAHGAPMVHQTSADGGQGINEYYNGMGRGGINATGNHALQDYQMQLMLLEQQNKKRLMMARAEQDQIHNLRGNEPRPDGSVPFQSQSVSPSGTRAAPSPQPSADIKRGTPKMGAQPGPGSPLPSDSNIQIQRGSPAASIAAFNGQPPIQNNAMMRPPSSHPGFPGVGPHMNEQAMNPALRQQAQAGRGQQMWAGPIPGTQSAQAAQAQMAQLAAQAGQAQVQGQAPQVAPSPASAGQPQNIGTPGQARPGGPHQAMPPPSAPAANQNAGRTSPQVNNTMPPTPTNKAGGAARKKDAKGDRKQSRPSKKGAGAAAANAGAAGAPTPSEAETPAPDTPMTPQNPNSFNAPGNVPKVQGGFQNPAVPVSGGGAASEAVPNPAAVAPPMTSTESSDNNSFGMMANIDGFGSMSNENELMEFDFESFLNPDPTGGSAEIPFDFSAFGPTMDDVGLEP